MNSRKKMMMGLVMALGSVAVGTSTARAAAVVDFQLGGSGGGTISYAGGATPLVGTNIPIGLVSGTGTPQNNFASLNLTGTCGAAANRACLSFTTGNETSAAGGVVTFGPGTVFTITGGIPVQTPAGAATFTPAVPNGTVLMTASTVQATLSAAGVFSLILPTGLDTVNNALGAYFFGTNPIAWSFAGSIFGDSAPTNGSAFTITNETSVDIGTSPVPEPMSVLLLGTAMVGIATVIRRRNKNQVTL